MHMQGPCRAWGRARGWRKYGGPGISTGYVVNLELERALVRAESGANEQVRAAGWEDSLDVARARLRNRQLNEFMYDFLDHYVYSIDILIAVT
jgi:hypothetical protein